MRRILIQLQSYLFCMDINKSKRILLIHIWNSGNLNDTPVRTWKRLLSTLHPQGDKHKIWSRTYSRFLAENEKNYFPSFLVTWVVFGKIFVRLSSSSLLLLLIMSSYFWIIITSCSLKYMEREWKAYVDEYTTSEILLSNCIAAAAFLTYCGAMGVDRR